MKSPSARSSAAALGLCLLAALQGALAEAAPRLRAQGLRAHAPLSPDGLLQVVRGDNATAVAAAVVLAASRDGPPSETFDLMKSLEDRLVEMKAATGLKATPGMMKFVTMTKGLIKDTVRPKVVKAHSEAQKLINSYGSGFTRCFAGESTLASMMTTLKSQRAKRSTDHRNCRRIEAKLFGEKSDCDKLLRAREEHMKIAEGALAQLMRDPDSEADKAEPAKKEKYTHWLDRNEDWFTKRKAAVVVAKKKYAMALGSFKRLKPVCQKKGAAWTGRRVQCNLRQEAFEEATCSLGKRMTEHCDNYHTCFADTKDTYLKEKPDIQKQEKDRLAEWTVLERMDCLLDVFAAKDGLVDDAQIAECTKKKHSTEHLDLSYPEVPTREKCPIVPAIPGQQRFRLVHYSKLPEASKARGMSLCVLKAGAGLALRAVKGAPKDNCYSVGSYLKASGGGSCLFAKGNREPMKIDYTKDRFTMYTFTVKMTGDPSNKNKNPTGGFSPCNVDGKGFKRGESPELNFVDSKDSWGYSVRSNGGTLSRYDDKDALGAAIPRRGGRQNWEVIVNWNDKKRKLYLYSWKVNGVLLSKYNDLPTSCWAKDNGDFGFTPRVWADPSTSAFSVKDLRVFQGVVPFNMPQIVGLGIPATTLQVTCALEGRRFVGPGVPGYGKAKVRSVKNCQKRCSYLSGCRYFTYDSGFCQYFSAVQSKKGESAESRRIVSGPASCEQGTTGLRADFWYSEAAFSSMPDPELQVPSLSRTDGVVWYHTTKMNWPGHRKRFFAGRWKGSLLIQAAGTYSLELESDNPSELLVDGKSVVKNPATKPKMTVVAKSLELGRGFHKIEVTTFRKGYQAGLKLRYKGPDTFSHRWLVPTEALRPRDP